MKTDFKNEVFNKIVDIRKINISGYQMCHKYIMAKSILQESKSFMIWLAFYNNAANFGTIVVHSEMNSYFTIEESGHVCARARNVHFHYSLLFKWKDSS